jgi:hypothetical protein
MDYSDTILKGRPSAGVAFSLSSQIVSGRIQRTSPVLRRVDSRKAAFVVAEFARGPDSSPGMKGRLRLAIRPQSEESIDLGGGQAE